MENNLADDKRYHAVIGLAFSTRDEAKKVLQSTPLTTILSTQSGFLSAAYSYPIRATYTMGYKGKPTLVGLRGYRNIEIIHALKANNQIQPELIDTMYDMVIESPSVKSIK